MPHGAPDNADRPHRLDGPFFERLFAGAELAVFACDRAGGVLAGSELGEKLFSLCGLEAQDANVRDVLPRRDQTHFDEHVATLLETSEPTEFRTRIVFQDGRTTEYAVWLAPVPDEHGKVENLSVWFHDITARMQLRRSMRKRERLTTLGALSGSVAHHYNNILCSIATSLEYALNMNTMSAMRRSLRRTADAVARAAELTQQLLAFAQADYRSIDMADLTETVLGYFDQKEARMSEQGVALDLEWRDVPILPVPRDHLMIVLDNLINNALEAMPQGGDLTVHLSRHDNDHIRLTIADTGAGISVEHMEHLFKPFFTTKGALADGDTRQAGMGLAVAYGLVNEMHGSITAENVPGGGARFDVILPITRPKQ